MQRLTDGSYELNDFVINTDVINRLVVDQKVTYTFALYPKERVYDRFFNLVMYFKDGWQSEIIEIYPSPEIMQAIKMGNYEVIEASVKVLYRSMPGTGCYTIFITIVNCIGCTGECDLCSICTNSYSVRICGNGNSAQLLESQPYAFSAPPTNHGGGGGASSGNPPTPTPNPPDEDEDQDPIYIEPHLDGSQVEKPCEQLKELSDPSTYNVTPQVNWCRNHVNGINKTEIGVRLDCDVQYDGTVYPATQFPEGGDEEVSIPLDEAGNTYGTIHTHPKNGHPMFSMSDIVNLKACFDGARPSLQPKVVNLLVCKSGDQTLTYAIKINDITKLSAQINIMMNNPLYSNWLEKAKLKKENSRLAQLYDDSGGNFEFAFLSKFKNYGISLFKATTEDLRSWEELVLDNNSAPSYVISKPCN